MTTLLGSERTNLDIAQPPVRVNRIAGFTAHILELKLSILGTAKVEIPTKYTETFPPCNRMETNNSSLQLICPNL
ncbi:uncharacterized protein N7529_007185 [Penicillium soppii]|uniref:uncharacterized protein n=1 Tax=Penicillium soppii TaxID=69789 RepID=UPI0025487A48|nr:uncharacterized protein N7529_007185 [Penicillium soppii]KAJ5865269.1 hypothetical protein N7529_007185 [Penicillium soppii]